MADIRVARLLQLITILRARTARNPMQLAPELGVSKRTIHRDLKALTNAHIPWRFDREVGGYRLGGDFLLPPVQLRLGEAMVVEILARSNCAADWGRPSVSARPVRG
jgi:predicted DNA-binding transcriptional regulator YafY